MEGLEVVLRFDLADEDPPGVLVRKYNTSGSPVRASGAGEGTGHVALSTAQAPVASPVEGAPILTTVALEGDNVRLLEALLRPGDRTSLSFSYQAEQGGRTFDVEETLAVQHHGRARVVAERGLVCA